LSGDLILPYMAVFESDFWWDRVTIEHSPRISIKL
jgi:hypothetical protein